MTKISVIVPCYGDAARVQLCVDALVNQRPCVPYEVVIVDNSPTFELKSTWQERTDVRLIHEPRPGSYAARNAGLAATCEEILAFTDADCIPAETWLQEGLEAIQAGADLVGGKIDVFAASADDADSGPVLYEMEFSFKQDKYVASGVAVTANLFARRTVFDVAGRFSDHMMSGGDVEFTGRAVKMGYVLVYSDRAVVKHPARTSVSALLKKAERVAGGCFRLRHQKPDFAEQFRVLGIAKFIASPVAWIFVLGADALRGNRRAQDAVKVAGVITVVRWYSAWIRLLYVLRLKSSDAR